MTLGPLPRRGQQGITASAAEVFNAPGLVEDTDNWIEENINNQNRHTLSLTISSAGLAAAETQISKELYRTELGTG